MVHIRLDQDWKDDQGKSHPAGTTVDVDPGTLAKLEAIGVVADPETPDSDWISPTGTGAV